MGLALASAQAKAEAKAEAAGAGSAAVALPMAPYRLSPPLMHRPPCRLWFPLRKPHRHARWSRVRLYRTLSPYIVSLFRTHRPPLRS